MSLDGRRVLIVESESRRSAPWCAMLRQAGALVDLQERPAKGLEALLLGAVTPTPHEVVVLGPSVGASMLGAFRHTLVGALSECRLCTLTEAEPAAPTGPVPSPGGATLADSGPTAAHRVVCVALGLTAPAAVPRPPEAPGSDPLHVLLVEDNPINQEVAEAALRHAGMRVRAVYDGRQAVEAVRSDRFDAVVMDIQMPVMDGLAATRAIRALGPPQGRVPVIAMTANVLPTHRRAAAAAGMDDFVEKPIRPDQLVQTIEAAVRGESRFAEGPGAPTAPDTPRRIDLQVLRDLQATFGPALSRVQATLARDAPRRRARMLEATRTHDYTGLQREAHSLKSSSATFGLCRVSQLCDTIETACRTDRPADARAAVHQLARVLDDDLALLASHMD